ncbi:hypothetical protein CYMTET_21524 [Cymbomonas tetramitiformis]|uniref:Uncharacterized protein n=1 Tax=Cymbomonas tetramitiformis TaxID=36881 RepID=A0AAE0L2T3_9CHLO|nr:hypothetical protein CYMTET_21524 [Cymbomonas tetramitiformis]
MDSLSWKDALTVVLRREGRPMHIHSIAWHCLEGGLVKSTARAPWNVVWAVLKGSTDDFVQCEEQIFTHVDAASFTHLDITAARAEAQRLKPQLDRLVDVKREGGGALGDDAPRAPEASSPPRVQEPAPLGAATPRTPSSRMSHFSVPLDEVQLETVTLDQLLELTDQLIEERSRADAADVRAAAAEQRAIEAELHLEALMKACRVLCTTSSSIEAEYRIATTSPHVPRHVPATATGGLRSAVYQAAQTSDVESLSASGIASQFRTDFQHLDAYPLSQTLFGEYGRGLHAYHPAERVAASITKTPHTPLAHRWWTDAGVGSHSLPPKVTTSAANAHKEHASHHPINSALQSGETVFTGSQLQSFEMLSQSSVLRSGQKAASSMTAVPYAETKLPGDAHHSQAETTSSSASPRREQALAEGFEPTAAAPDAAPSPPLYLAHLPSPPKLHPPNHSLPITHTPPGSPPSTPPRPLSPSTHTVNVTVNAVLHDEPGASSSRRSLSPHRVQVHANTSLRHPYDDQSSGVSEVPTDAQIAVETPAAAEVEVAAPSNARVTRVVTPRQPVRPLRAAAPSPAPDSLPLFYTPARAPPSSRAASLQHPATALPAPVPMRLTQPIPYPAYQQPRRHASAGTHAGSSTGGAGVGELDSVKEASPTVESMWHPAQGQQAETLSTRTSPRSVRSPLGDREKGGSNELGARITSRGSSPEEFISRAQLASSSRAVVSGPGVGLEQGPSGMGPVVEPLYGARRPGPVEREVVQEPKAEIWKTNAASEQLEITTAVIAPPLCDAFVYIGALLRPEEADGFFKGVGGSHLAQSLRISIASSKPLLLLVSIAVGHEPGPHWSALTVSSSTARWFCSSFHSKYGHANFLAAVQFLSLLSRFSQEGGTGPLPLQPEPASMEQQRSGEVDGGQHLFTSLTVEACMLMTNNPASNRVDHGANNSSTF